MKTQEFNQIEKNNLADETLSEIVKKDFKTAPIFEKYNLDFCCGGNRTLKESCEKNNIDLFLIIDELNSIQNKNSFESLNFNNWELDFLSEYIINVHHSYVRNNIPLITSHSEKVVVKHSEHHPEVIKVKGIFDEVKMELLSHLNKEEQILFPYIKSLVTAKKMNTKVQAQFGTIANPIRMMETEHENAGNAFHLIYRLTNNYTIPPDACNTFVLFYKELDAYEKDLHKHIHLENNILFPKAIELEKELNGN
ncbi:MAG: iron-sulfur cluster repair di-iron protein [Ignavibacterium sp.]